MTLEPTNAELWKQIVAADRQLVADQIKTWNKIDDKVACLQAAISTVLERGTALRLLLILQAETLKRSVFENLVDQASVGHSDIGLCRDVIKTMSRAWVLEHISDAVSRVIDRDPDDYEPYRRFAELYAELDDRLLLRWTPVFGPPGAIC